jgi:hypothetical protein
VFKDVDGSSVHVTTQSLVYILSRPDWQLIAIAIQISHLILDLIDDGHWVFQVIVLSKTKNCHFLLIEWISARSDFNNLVLLDHLLRIHAILRAIFILTIRQLILLIGLERLPRHLKVSTQLTLFPSSLTIVGTLHQRVNLHLLIIIQFALLHEFLLDAIVGLLEELELSLLALYFI